VVNTLDAPAREAAKIRQTCLAKCARCVHRMVGDHLPPCGYCSAIGHGLKDMFEAAAEDGDDGAAPVDVEYDEGGAQRLLDGVMGTARATDDGPTVTTRVAVTAPALLAYVAHIGAEHDAIVFCAGYNARAAEDAMGAV
jgi:hypothetical protein